MVKLSFMLPVTRLLLSSSSLDFKVVAWHLTYSWSGSLRQSDDMPRQGAHSLGSTYCTHRVQ